MDLKSKGMAWVGNICQKFETMCHEVDNLVKQDTVSYVENQANNVRDSMKKFCSDVVQDLFPPSVNNAKCGALVMDLKTNDPTGSYLKSVINIEEDKGHFTLTKQSPMEPSDFNPIVKQMDNSFDAPHFVNQSTTSTSGDAILWIQPEALLEKIDEGSTIEDADTSAEESAPKEESSESKILDLTSHIDAEKLQTAQIVGTICDDPGNDSHCVSDTSITVTLPEIEFSVESSKKEVAELKFASSCSSMFMEQALSDKPVDSIPTEIVSCSTPVNLYSHDSDGSTLLLSHTSPTVSSKIKETALASSNSVLSMESIGCLGDSSYIVDEMTGSDLESIDLSDKERLDESCVMVDNSLSYGVSCRIPKFRSYKKIIQDAFTSKKRLAKEYKLLALWYGDIDTESSQGRKPSELSSSATITTDSALQVHPVHDNEWELL